MSNKIFNISSICFVKKSLKYSNKKIPKKISIKSDIEQIKQTIKTYCFFKPCSITNTFWAPKARIRLKPVKNPKNKNSIFIYYFLFSKKDII